MHSPIVVISWWSNALGLTCLHHLLTYAADRPLYVIQVGKSLEGRRKFREMLPPEVIEIHYPENAPCEHSRVIAYLVHEMFADMPGIWIFDHDVFLQEDCNAWLQTADILFKSSSLCLCAHRAPTSPAITQPAFWMSPNRLPATLPSFDPIPFVSQKSACRPDLYRNSGELQIPIKDTLVAVWEVLVLSNQAVSYALDGEKTISSPFLAFPKHEHLGGLFLLAGTALPLAFSQWMQTTVVHLTRFYETCVWRTYEDPILLQRLQEFQEVCHVL